MNIQNLQTNNQTMSSREIAGLCDKQHGHVKRDIEIMCQQIAIDVSRFGCIYLDGSNRQQVEYMLDKDLTITLAAVLWHLVRCYCPYMSRCALP